MINIIGAGMAGLLAARMLHRYDPVVHERQKELPNNHSAVLRFRTPAVGEILGVPFKKVKVLKSTWMWHGPVASVLSYSDKVSGAYRTDRSIDTRTEVVDRYIAPPDLVKKMAEGVNIQYGVDVDLNFREDLGKVISTIPMQTLMIMLEYPNQPTFGYTMGLNIVARVSRCDAYASVYTPDPELPFYRVSLTGDQLIIECAVPPVMFDKEAQGKALAKACFVLGIDPDRIDKWEARTQRYAKILPIDERARRDFIYWASTVRGKAFSLGRFACWRPGLLMDDVVKDVRFIEKMMTSPTPGWDAERHHHMRGGK